MYKHKELTVDVRRFLSEEEMDNIDMYKDNKYEATGYVICFAETNLYSENNWYLEYVDENAEYYYTSYKSIG